MVQADTDVATWAALPVGLTRHVAVGHLEVALCSFVHVAPAFSARNQRLRHSISMAWSSFQIPPRLYYP